MKIYRAELLTKDGQLVAGPWEQKTNEISDPRKLLLDINVRFLRAGDYQVNLQRLSTKHTSATLTYRFTMKTE